MRRYLWIWILAGVFLALTVLSVKGALYSLEIQDESLNFLMGIVISFSAGGTIALASFALFCWDEDRHTHFDYCVSPQETAEKEEVRWIRCRTSYSQVERRVK